MLMEYQPSGTSIHLSFGIAYHKAMEIYHKARAVGADFDLAQLSALSFALSWDEGKDPDKYKNRLTLIRTVVWYLEKFKSDPLQTVILADGSAAVELSFRYSLNIESPDGDPFFYCGHIDRLSIMDDDYYWVDYKTTKSALSDYFFAGFSPNLQMTGYFAASQIILDRPARGGFVDAAQLLINSSRFERRAVHRSPAQLAEFYTALAWWMGQAQRFAEESYYPMNEKACNNYGGCPFRPVCSRDPSNRSLFLKADYEKFSWNPLETRDV